MPFINAQKVVRDDSGRIISGSASLSETIYVHSGTKNHSKHIVREKLGKVLYLSDDKKIGIFISPTRGLVEYNATTDSFNDVDRDDERISACTVFPNVEIHTVFGDAYLLLIFLKKCGLTDVVHAVFQKKEDYERVLCHIVHGILKDGSRISCDNFIMKSFASYVFPDIPVTSLKSDTRFYALLGNDNIKVSFFKEFISFMRKKNPKFGKGCYVDSTPLPNDISDNPFNALSSHGITGTGIMTRLILVLDEETGLPVWYDLIPGNILDISTVKNVMEDVAASLQIEIDSLILDAGYISKELLQAFSTKVEKTIIGRMPARKGFPFKELYWDVKSLIGKGKYAFVRNKHTYFGYCKKIQIFGVEEYAYVYVDQNNAIQRFGTYLSEHEAEFSELKLKDKDWQTVKYGYFVLISNKEKEPKDMLTEYFGRTQIETVFKTSKEYLDLLPLCKWTDQTIRGKILHDIIDTIAFLMLRKQLTDSAYSTSEIFGKAQSLMCIKNSNIVTVETPNKQLKQYYKMLDIEVPSHIKLSDFCASILELKM